MSVFVTGDTHCPIDIDKIYKLNNATEKDYLIVTGDGGFVWNNSQMEIYMRKQLQRELPFTILYVDGNHENFHLLKQYKLHEFNGGLIHKINNKLFHLTRGQVFNLEGNKIFTFGGACSTDKENRIENISWWREELPNFLEQEEGLNVLEQHNNEVDYIITHDLPYSSYLKICNSQGYFHNFNDSSKDYLELIKNTIKYKKWYCGHYHIDEYLIHDNIRVLYNDIIQIS